MIIVFKCSLNCTQKFFKNSYSFEKESYVNVNYFTYFKKLMSYLFQLREPSQLSTASIEFAVPSLTRLHLQLELPMPQSAPSPSPSKLEFTSMPTRHSSETPRQPPPLPPALHLRIVTLAHWVLAMATPASTSTTGRTHARLA